MGIINGEDYQIVYSDTPGILEPKYSLHEAMMTYVKVSLEDADVILLVVEVGDTYDENLYARIRKSEAPIIILLNKIDLTTKSETDQQVQAWREAIPEAREVIPVSAVSGENLDAVLEHIRALLPIHPAYFPDDEFTDRTERFFASEILREKIFLHYSEEIPYSCEVDITAFKDEPDIIRISAVIFVERESQKGIVIGKGGSALKKVATDARKDMESFFGKKIFLETQVKVATNWRRQRDRLRQFGYYE